MPHEGSGAGLYLGGVEDVLLKAEGIRHVTSLAYILSLACLNCLIARFIHVISQHRNAFGCFKVSFIAAQTMSLLADGEELGKCTGGLMQILQTLGLLQSP